MTTQILADEIDLRDAMRLIRFFLFRFLAVSALIFGAFLLLIALATPQRYRTEAIVQVNANFMCVMNGQKQSAEEAQKQGASALCPYEAVVFANRLKSLIFHNDGFSILDIKAGILSDPYYQKVKGDGNPEYSALDILSKASSVKVDDAGTMTIQTDHVSAERSQKVANGLARTFFELAYAQISDQLAAEMAVVGEQSAALATSLSARESSQDPNADNRMPLRLQQLRTSGEMAAIKVAEQNASRLKTQPFLLGPAKNVSLIHNKAVWFGGLVFSFFLSILHVWMHAAKRNAIITPRDAGNAFREGRFVLGKHKDILKGDGAVVWQEAILALRRADAKVVAVAFFCKPRVMRAIVSGLALQIGAKLGRSGAVLDLGGWLGSQPATAARLENSQGFDGSPSWSVYAGPSREAGSSIADLRTRHNPLLVLAPDSDQHLIENADLFALADLRVVVAQSGIVTKADARRLTLLQQDLPDKNLVVVFLE